MGGEEFLGLLKDAQPRRLAVEPVIIACKPDERDGLAGILQGFLHEFALFDGIGGIQFGVQQQNG